MSNKDSSTTPVKDEDVIYFVGFVVLIVLALYFYFLDDDIVDYNIDYVNESSVSTHVVDGFDSIINGQDNKGAAELKNIKVSFRKEKSLGAYAFSTYYLYDVSFDIYPFSFRFSVEQNNASIYLDLIENKSHPLSLFEGKDDIQVTVRVLENWTPTQEEQARIDRYILQTKSIFSDKELIALHFWSMALNKHSRLTLEGDNECIIDIVKDTVTATENIHGLSYFWCDPVITDYSRGIQAD